MEANAILGLFVQITQNSGCLNQENVDTINSIWDRILKKSLDSVGDSQLKSTANEGPAGDAASRIAEILDSIGPGDASKVLGAAAKDYVARSAKRYSDRWP